MTERPRAVFSRRTLSIAQQEGVRSPVFLKGQTWWQSPAKTVLSGRAGVKPGSGAAGVRGTRL